MAEYLFKKYPYFDSGKLSRAKAFIVSEGSLSKVAQELQLGKLLLMSKGEEKDGGRTKPSVLSDALEALVGAIFLLGGWKKAKRFVLSAFRSLLSSAEGAPLKDYKSLLQEHLQALGKSLPRYVLVGQEGPPHQKVFEVEVIIEGETMGKGRGNTKKEAEMRAAKGALLKLLGKEN